MGCPGTARVHNSDEVTLEIWHCHAGREIKEGETDETEAETGALSEVGIGKGTGARGTKTLTGTERGTGTLNEIETGTETGMQAEGETRINFYERTNIRGTKLGTAGLICPPDSVLSSGPL